jgi:hypothetical protein
MPTETISLIIAFLGVCIAFATSMSNARKDASKAEGRMGEIITKLDFISDDLKDIKADYRRISVELQEVRDIAVRAQASAASAHKRIDSADLEHHAGIGGTN